MTNEEIREFERRCKMSLEAALIDAEQYQTEPEFDRINHGPFEHPVE